MTAACEHIEAASPSAPRTPDGCEECLASGDDWFHLRLCLTCGHVGCCDTSKNKHASAHFHATEHPVIQSFQPDEEWVWCFPDEIFVDSLEQGSG